MSIVILLLTIYYIINPKYRGIIKLLTSINISYILLNLNILKKIEGEFTIIDGLLIMDSTQLIAIIIMTSIITIIIQPLKDISWEFHLLLIGGLTGAILLISSYDWLIAVISFELLNLSTYLLLSLFKGTESATLKYLILSALFTTVLLLAISIIYSKTGVIHFDGIISEMYYLNINLAKYLILLTIGFKLGLVPFHLWVPDVYEGISWELLMWMSTIPKIAILFWLPLLNKLLAEPISNILLTLGLLSFILAAIQLPANIKLKRFLAYSAIGHMGIIITGFCIGEYHGYWYYIVVYMLATLSLLIIVMNFNIIKLKDLNIITSNYVLSIAFIITILTIASLPPLPGFYAKLLILLGTIEINYYPIAFALILTSVRTAAYYLKLLQTTFFNPLQGARIPVGVSHSVSYMDTVNNPLCLAILTVLLLPTLHFIML